MLCEFLPLECKRRGRREEGEEEEIIVLILLLLVWLHPQIPWWDPGDCTPRHGGGR